jgi:4-hydroxy-tetrahydrodipicolinate reductase
VLEHNVCGREIYAEGTVDAAAFLAGVATHREPKQRHYNMVDVLQAGAMN